MNLDDILKSKSGEIKTPYADKFVEFQNTLDEAFRAKAELDLAIYNNDSLRNEYRENFHRLNVKCLALYSDMLGLVQQAGLLDD